MALIEELEKSGNWLFRWRSYLPLAVLGLCLACMPSFHYPLESAKLDHFWEFFCLAVGFSGLGIRVFTIGYTPAGTSGRNTDRQIADELNTTGLYSLVRNPLYLGNYFMYLSVALFMHQWWLVVIFTLAFWLYYERIIFAEEAFLRKKFGQQYLDWATRVPAICPRFTGYVKPKLAFSYRNVLRREYNGFFALVLVLFLMEELGEFNVKSKLEFETEWVALVAASFVIWLTLRTIKKRTRLFNVEGR